MSKNSAAICPAEWLDEVARVPELPTTRRLGPGSKRHLQQEVPQANHMRHALRPLVVVQALMADVAVMRSI
jgi:hypothetical protein